MMRRPGRAFLFTGATLLLLGIGVNALFLQNARHPAPFFRGQEQARSAEPAQVNVPVPPARPSDAAAKPAVRQAGAPAASAPERIAAQPVENKPAGAARPAQREAAVREIPAKETLAREAPAKETTQQAAAPKVDPIAALLREGRPNTLTPPGSIPNPSAEQTKRILAVQEALKKLGHNVKLDGVAGPTTRVAIEAFERAQKLQVSGQMSPRVLRELASRSGVRIP